MLLVKSFTRVKGKFTSLIVKDNDTFLRKIIKLGNSRCLTIPTNIIEELEFENGVTVTRKGKKLIVEAQKPKKEQ